MREGRNGSDAGGILPPDPRRVFGKKQLGGGSVGQSRCETGGEFVAFAGIDGCDPGDLALQAGEDVVIVWAEMSQVFE
jgi:hypothetical protein